MLKNPPTEEDRYLVYLVSLVCFVERNEPDEPNQPDKQNKPGLSRMFRPSKFCCAEMIFPQPARLLLGI
jgi:hypothetical protein